MKVNIDRTKTNQLLRGIIIGALAGFVVSTFRLLIEWELKLIKIGYQFLHQQPGYLVVWVLISVLLALGLGKLTQGYPAIKGSGIPQIEGQLAGDYEEAWWPVLWRKFIGGVLAIGSGLFLGREGPSIQLGATIGQGFAEFRHDKPLARRVSIASGAAAGLSAAFNAPIASTMFVLEEAYHNFSPVVWLSAFVSALSADFISLNFFGLTPVLHITYAHSLPVNQYGHLLILGIILGILGRLYQVSLLNMGRLYGRLKLPAFVYPVVPFILVIIIGWYWPQTLGGGNSLIVNLTRMNPSVLLFGGLLLLRFLFSMVSYGSELPGGIFLPILTLGAVIGGLYGAAMHAAGLLPSVYIANFIIYAMAGYFAGIGKAPFTAILLITEMVGSLGHLMPLAVVSLVAYVVVDILNGAPIYASLLEKLLQREPQLIANKSQDVIHTTVFVGALLDGKQVRDFNWPKSCLLYAIHRGEQQLIPHGDTEIKAGDTLLISVAPRMRHSAFVKIITAAQGTEKNK